MSDPEPLPEKEPVEIKREDIETYYTLKDELGRCVIFCVLVSLDG